MDIPKPPEALLSSHGSSHIQNNAGREDEFETIKPDEEVKISAPNTSCSRYPEFAHLKGTNRSAYMSRKNQHYVKGGSIQSSRNTYPAPTLPLSSAPSNTLHGSSIVASLPHTDDDENIEIFHTPQDLDSPGQVSAIPELFASAEPFLSTPVNAMIRHCYKHESNFEERRVSQKIISTPNTPPTPEIPLRSYKRLIPNGRQIGEIFDQWGSTTRLQHFEQHFEVAEWIRLLKEKADMTVDSMQKPPSSKQPRPSLDSSQSECENALKPYRCPYLVMRLAAKDDIGYMPQWKQRLYKTTPLSSLLAIIFYWIYFILRIIYTVLAQRASNQVFALPWVFVVIEIGVTLPAMFHQFWQCVALKLRNRPKLRIISDFTPTVDVFITCCNEENDLILDTVRAAVAVSWPISRFRVIILDDGASRSLQSGIENLSKTFPNLYYTAREKVPSAPHHFKAGNLNHGLQFTEGLKEGPGEFCAALDADMIPERDWLRAVVAHLVVDPDMALACPPQLFYNVPKNDPIAQSLNTFVHTIERVKDTAGVAWCTGSGYAIRRCAIDDIGGFPTGSLAEDVCTSSMLLGAGWKTAYIHEPLQFGTVPDSFLGHIKQRTRWTIGTIQTSLRLNFFLYGPLIREMTFLQRLCGFIYAISSFSTIFVTLSLLVMPIGVISGYRIIAFADYTQLRWLIRAFFLVLFFNRVNEWTMSLPAGYRLGRRDSNAILWMAPYYAITVVRCFLLPKALGGKTATFISSGGIHSSLEERCRQRRAPLLTRLKVILGHYRASMHLLYILFCTAAIATSISRAITLPHNHQTLSSPSSGSNSHSQTVQTLVYLLTHTFWPPLLMWIICMSACWAPISYAIWPPDMPDREELLERDGDGIARPREEAKSIVWGRWIWFHEGLYSFLTVYIVVVFVGSWLY